MSTCTITPLSAFQSTNLNSKINCFGRLADRITRTLGAPVVTVEIHQDQLFENISIACEMFTKWAGYTQEYIVFDSSLYERNKGIRLDHLFTLANSELTNAERIGHTTESKDTAPYLAKSDSVWVATSGISSTVFSSITALSGIFTANIYPNQIFDSTLYSLLTSETGTTYANRFQQSYVQPFTINGVCAPDSPALPAAYNNMFDYDIMDYRKVISVTDFEEGSSNGINTLFTIEQTMAQQTYFSYAMGNYGFDMISWYILKDWMKMREKLLAQHKSIEFNDRTQYLRMYPQPTDQTRFYGILSCYVERPLRDIIKEQWVYQYALCLCKQTLMMSRGKLGSIPMFGGQLFNTNMLEAAQAEKEKLEENLMNGTGSSFTAPPIFMIG